MSGDEVRTILNKARYRWQAAQGATGTAITSGDGRVRVIWETGAANGRIRFTDTGYCSRFEGVRNGIEDCYRLYRTGRRDFTVVRQDGTPSGTIALLEIERPLPMYESATDSSPAPAHARRSNCRASSATTGSSNSRRG